MPQFPYWERGLTVALSLALLWGLKQGLVLQVLATEFWSPVKHSHSVGDRVCWTARMLKSPSSWRHVSKQQQHTGMLTHRTCPPGVHLDSCFLLTSNENDNHCKLFSCLGVYSPPFWPGKESRQEKAGILNPSGSTAGRPASITCTQ